MQQKSIIIFLLFVLSLPVFSQKVSVIADGGYSHRLFLIPDSTNKSYSEYLKGKRPGKNFGIEAIYYNEGHGFGFKFSTFLNSVSGKNIDTTLFNKVNINENIRINYFSLQYHWQNQISNLPLFYEVCAGLGLIRYKSEGKEDEEKSVILGKSYGMNAAFSFEYAIFEHLSLGSSVDFMIGKLVQGTHNGYIYNFKPQENITRLDLNLFTRFSF